MTMEEYEALSMMSRENSSRARPYARALPVYHWEECSYPIPEDKLAKSYHAPWALSKITVRHALAFYSLVKGTSTKLHVDPGDSFFTQIYGRKRWLFVDAKYATQLKVYADVL